MSAAAFSDDDDDGGQIEVVSSRVTSVRMTADHETLAQRIAEAKAHAAEGIEATLTTYSYVITFSPNGDVSIRRRVW
jgi:hypothetical protein